MKVKKNIGSRWHYRKRGFCDCGNPLGRHEIGNEKVCDSCFSKDYTRFSNQKIARERRYCSVRRSEGSLVCFYPTPSPLFEWYRVHREFTS